MSASTSSPPAAGLHLRPAAWPDAAQLWSWRNEATTRQHSLHTEEVPWPEHERWLRARLQSPATCRIWIAEVGREAVGQIRYELDGGEAAWISLSLAPEWRGRGLGTELLRRSLKLAWEQLPAARLLGWVRRNNLASQRMFLRAGFVASPAVLPNGDSGWRMELTRIRASASGPPLARLGRTGLNVSRLALGTVEFGGPPYGVAQPGEAAIPDAEAVRLLRLAWDSGINYFDTAPAYGRSEAVVGSALDGKAATIATKISAIPDAVAAAVHVDQSLAASARHLRRDTLDIVQIHNLTPALLRSDLLPQLARAQELGRVRFLGASVYGEEAALAAMATGVIDVLQIAFNLLDQRPRARIFAEAQRTGVGLVVRSALLKGVLSRRSQWLPPQLGKLAEAADRARARLGESWETLPAAALRFCWTAPEVTSVLIGIQHETELAAALRAAAAGPLDPWQWAAAGEVALNDAKLLDPSQWGIA